MRAGVVVRKVDCSTQNCEEDLTTKSILDWDSKGGSDEESPDRVAFMFYCYSLHLLAALCNGRNVLARQKILAVSKSHNLGLEFESLHSVVSQCRRCRRTALLPLPRVFHAHSLLSTSLSLSPPLSI